MKLQKKEVAVFQALIFLNPKKFMGRSEFEIMIWPFLKRLTM